MPTQRPESTRSRTSVERMPFTAAADSDIGRWSDTHSDTVVWIAGSTTRRTIGSPGPAKVPATAHGRIVAPSPASIASRKVAGTLVVKQDAAHLVSKGAQLLYYHADPFVTDGVNTMRALATPS